MSPFLKTAIAFLLVLSGEKNAHAANEAEEARWLVQTATWGTLSWLEGDSVSSMVTSFGESAGRLFIYIPHGSEFPGSITISEAQINPDQFEGAKCGPDGDLDPEDPRCAKLTLSGAFKPVEDANAKKFAEDALFTSHPQMKAWPDDHGFAILEMDIQDVWMIANYGGGGTITSSNYYAAEPVHHPAKGFDFGNRKMGMKNSSRQLARPNFKSSEAHARWLVANSLWTTVSTDGSDRLGEGTAWGNIRSVVDGECIFSSLGLPVFYLPSPDPTSIDVQASNVIALSFSEAYLPELVGKEGKACGGTDPEDPTCAKISLHGNAVPLKENELEYVQKAFGTTHPRASWLANGGAHTGGSFYTIDVHSIEFFRNYGGMADITVEDYLNWKPDASDFPGQTGCDARPSTPSHGAANYDHTSSHSAEGGQGYTSGGDQKTTDAFPSSEFLSGAVFGFMIWGPTIALIVYHRVQTSRQEVTNHKTYGSIADTVAAVQVV